MNKTLSSVHPEAKIAKDVTIASFVTIAKDVVIGEGTWIGPNVTIMDGARIGRNCKIFPGAVISTIPQDLKYQGEETYAILGDNVIVREFATINKGTKANNETVIGNDTLIMAYAHIAHDCLIGKHCILANAVTLAGHIKIEDWAILGGLAAVHQFVNIGQHSMISGGALVRKDVPPYTKAAREPLSFVGINSVGLRRRGFSSEKIKEIQEIYRILYMKKMNVSQAAAYLEAEYPATDERDEILSFINNSKRGIMKGYSGNGAER
ncbi:MAG: acyl-ACP--UDP-N-acetylglucosamine O-acyltransferase [Bacteroidales bacterium]|nr:acyl-ACP--UDP-N-acetylglucosamine O-acyltransferase [Bacteroidales bacterium]